MNQREEIVYGVWAVIAEKGLPGVTMRAVAAAAEVSVGRVQHYFKSKNSLILESCRAMIEHAYARYDEGTDDPRTRLAEAIRHVIPGDATTRLGTTVWNAYVAQAVVDPEIARLLAESKRGQENEVARLLQELGHDNAVEVARSLIAQADGLVQRVLIGDLSYEEAHAVVESALPKQL